MYYLKRLLNKIEDQMIVVLNFIFVDRSYLLALDDSFMDLLIEKYRLYLLRKIKWNRDIDKKTFNLKSFISLFSYTNLLISIMDHEFWRGTRQSSLQELELFRTDNDLLKNRCRLGFNVKIQQ